MASFHNGNRLYLLVVVFYNCRKLSCISSECFVVQSLVVSDCVTDTLILVYLNVSNIFSSLPGLPLDISTPINRS